MTMINRFREATRELHEQIETENQAKKILDHSITLQEYKVLLLQNYIAYSTTEKEISRFLPGYHASKHQQIEQDLKALNVDTSIVLDYEDQFSCHNMAEALGTAYVVEGSALGGVVIGRELKNCPELSGLAPQHFFSGTRDNVKDWNNYKKMLESRPFSEEEKDMATEKAKKTFLFFRKVFSEAGKAAI